MHPRVSVSGLCFPELSAPDAIEAIAGLGVASTSVTGAKARAAGAGAVVAASAPSVAWAPPGTVCGPARLE